MSPDKKVPKYCLNPKDHHQHHHVMYCKCGKGLHCHVYFFVSNATNNSPTYYKCLDCNAVRGYTSNQDGR